MVLQALGSREGECDQVSDFLIQDEDELLLLLCTNGLTDRVDDVDIETRRLRRTRSSQNETSETKLLNSLQDTSLNRLFNCGTGRLVTKHGLLLRMAIE